MIIMGKGRYNTVRNTCAQTLTSPSRHLFVSIKFYFIFILKLFHNKLRVIIIHKCFSFKYEKRYEIQTN